MNKDEVAAILAYVTMRANQDAAATAPAPAAPTTDR
jgi:hypothetical protein